MRRNRLKRLLSVMMASAMIFGMCPVGTYAEKAEDAASDTFSYEKLDADEVTAQIMNAGEDAEAEIKQNEHDAKEQTRVMIVLEDTAAISLASEPDEDIAGSIEVKKQRMVLNVAQKQLAQRISDEVLGGESLDVVWNLTLAANAISANIEYGQIEEIRKMDGVKEVYVETRYFPMSEASTDNIVAQEMTGADSVKYMSGYTGAGTRVAVIDTGTDTDHQSFSTDGYEYSLRMQAEKRGLSYDEYAASLNLLTKEEIDAVLPQLNSYSRYEGLNAEDLYQNAKLPYNFNYVDVNLDVTHDNDTEGEHGSHVAGITTANTYIEGTSVQYDFNGDGAFDREDAQALMDAVIKGDAISHEENADLSFDGVTSAYDVHLLLEVLEDYETTGKVYVPAETTVGVTGVAPDAQLITMKVFGAAGGAYTSDYMASVEDAILLGCDAVNLSLGSAYPGSTSAHDETESLTNYVNGLLETVSNSGIVMCVAAGNAGNWADNDDAFGLMYTDETGTFNNSDPSTYTNSLAVASVDNIGLVSKSKTVILAKDGSDEMELSLEDVADGLNELWETLDADGKGTDYEIVFLGDPSGLLNGEEQTDESIYGGTAEDFSDYDFTGKIVLISRGNLISFADKHTNGAAAGAAAVIIYNNVAGSLSASISGSTAVIPCGGITLAEAKAIYDLCQKDENGIYSADVTITSGLNVNHGEDVVYPTMSDFSSWGPTGALTIKPEITAPGGAIYSVNGALEETDGYEIMSGTSMATPHVTGLVALANQYAAETGLLEKARTVSGNDALSVRNLVQSMLMSTATPLIEESSMVEYSVRNQGAGLASIDSLVEADSFILVDGQEDGKVKAELGDGGKDGWSFSFTIYNLTDQELVYDLDASILTTGTAAGEDEGKTYSLATDELTALGADVTYAGSGVSEQKARVGAGGSTKVTVTIKVTEAAAAHMKELGYTNGFYVEGYLYAKPEADNDAIHSIPLLGWYGNWTDPSMFDTGSFIEMIYGSSERPSHIYSETKNLLTWSQVGSDRGNYYTGNIYGGYFYGILFGDQRYIEARNAINTTEDSNWGIYAIFPTLIRTVGDFRIEVRDAEDGTLYFVDNYEDVADRSMIPCFYYTNAGQWYDTTGEYGVGVAWDYTDMEGNPIPEGRTFTVSLVCAPEYYINEDGSVRWDELGKGASLSYNFTIDNTAPDLAEELSYENEELRFTVQDNNYVAAVVLLNGSATEVAEYYYPDMDEELRGAAVTGSFNMTEFKQQYGNKAVIAVCDYAGNETYYAINLGGDGASYGEFVAFQYDDEGNENNAWVSFSEGVNENETALFSCGQHFVCAEYVNGYVYAETNSGELYAIPYKDIVANTVNLETTFIARLNQVYQDLAYNYNDGKMYAMEVTESNGYPTSTIYAFDLAGSDAYNDTAYTAWVADRGGVSGLAFAVDDDGILYLLGPSVDLDGAEDTTATLWKCEIEESEWGDYYGPFVEVGNTGLSMNYLQSMTWNHNNESLYWARFYPESHFDQTTELLKVNPNTAECEKVGTLSVETACLFAPLSAETAALEVHQNVPAINEEEIGLPVLSNTNLSMNVGGTAQLTCMFNPWYTKYKEVTWSSDNEAVASVDQNGLVTAKGNGNCTITVASKQDSSYMAQCSVSVASLSLAINGITTKQNSGVGSTDGVYLYQYTMDEGQSSMSLGNEITASGEFEGYGLDLSTSTEAKGSVWACEYGNTGIVYQINKESGTVEDMLMPIDGDMLFGMSYSEKTGNFTGIMNFYLYVDQPFTHEAEEEIVNSYDENEHEFTWHKFDMSEYLNASEGNLVTKEEGLTSIVFCAVTNIEGDGTAVTDTYKDYLGNWDMGGTLMYVPDTTIVLLDNTGRLWYIDEITGLSEVEEWGEIFYMDEEGMNYISSSRRGVMALPYEDGTNSVFVIRKVEETPLHDMFLNGTLPGITYTFSSMYATKDEETGRPIFFLSLYDYWNNGTTNHFYLYIPGEEEWGYKISPDVFYEIGTSGEGNIITTIHSAEVTGGLVLDSGEEAYSEASKSYIGYYNEKRS